MKRGGGRFAMKCLLNAVAGAVLFPHALALPALHFRNRYPRHASRTRSNATAVFLVVTTNQAELPGMRASRKDSFHFATVVCHTAPASVATISLSNLVSRLSRVCQNRVRFFSSFQQTPLPDWQNQNHRIAQRTAGHGRKRSAKVLLELYRKLKRPAPRLPPKVEPLSCPAPSISKCWSVWLLSTFSTIPPATAHAGRISSTTAAAVITYFAGRNRSAPRFKVGAGGMTPIGRCGVRVNRRRTCCKNPASLRDPAYSSIK